MQTLFLVREWSLGTFVSHFTVTGRIALLKRWSMESASRYGVRQWSVSLLAGCADILHLFPNLPTVQFLIAAKTASNQKWTVGRLGSEAESLPELGYNSVN